MAEERQSGEGDIATEHTVDVSIPLAFPDLIEDNGISPGKQKCHFGLEPKWQIPFKFGILVMLVEGKGRCKHLSDASQGGGPLRGEANPQEPNF